MLNKVQLIGHIGKDPEVRTFEGGNRKASFSIATSERRKNKSGELKESTEWHNIVCWDTLADIAQKYFRKGQQVYVEGKITTRQWEANDGTKKYITEVVASQIQLLGKQEKAASNQDTPWD